MFLRKGESQDLGLVAITFGLFLFLFFNAFIYFERESTSEGGAEKDTQNVKQAPGSKLSAQSPMWGLNSQTVSEIMN